MGTLHPTPRDALVIGAGIVGCASALRLAQRGVDVTVLERKRVGERAASSAAAGMLGAQLEAHPVAAMQALCVASRDRYDGFVKEVCALSDRRVEHRPTGALRVAYDEQALADLQRDVALQNERGFSAEVLDGDRIAALEPTLAPVLGGARFLLDGVVDPPSLLTATRLAAQAAGARFEEDAGVTALSMDETGAVNGVCLEEGVAPRRADVVVLCAGSWSTRIEGVQRFLPRHSVEPVRGQILEVGCAPGTLRHIIVGPDAYLSPRADGRVLIGATTESVGFERAITLGAVAKLSAAAERMVPALAHAELRAARCGFRAGTPDGLPILDRAGGLVVATGHYRNGIVLAPVTADVVTALAMGDEPPFYIAPFSIQRLAAGR